VTYDMNARLTVAEAAIFFGMSKAAINMWYVSGHLSDVTHNGKGHRLYLFAELLKAERETRHSSNSSRSVARRKLVAA
jgi:hypothetical protein